MIVLNDDALYPADLVAKMLNVHPRTLQRAARKIGKKIGHIKTPLWTAAEIRKVARV